MSSPRRPRAPTMPAQPAAGKGPFMPAGWTTAPPSVLVLARMSSPSSRLRRRYHGMWNDDLEIRHLFPDGKVQRYPADIGPGRNAPCLDASPKPCSIGPWLPLTTRCA